MKNLFLSSALSIASLVIAPSVFAGPGESLGNTKNDCNTSGDTCPITPTKFSAKIYRVALCTSNPMPSTTLDWDGNGCVEFITVLLEKKQVIFLAILEQHFQLKIFQSQPQVVIHT